MCYRCQICTTVVPHNTQLKRHILYREVNGRLLEWRRGRGVYIIRREILKEIPVCENCEIELISSPLVDVVRRLGRSHLKGTIRPSALPPVRMEARKQKRLEFGTPLGEASNIVRNGSTPSGKN